MEVQGKLLHYILLLFTLRPDVAGYSVLNMTEIYNYTDENGMPTQDHREMTNANVSLEGTYPQKADDFKLSVENSNKSDIVIFHWGLLIPDSYIVHINFGLSIQIATVNVIVLWIFLQKKNRSPVTIFLCSLAISDTISAVTSVSDFIGYTFFSNQIMGNIWRAYYPQCIFIPYLYLASYYFHLASVYITTVLSAQKAIAVLFPFWSKTHINNKVCVVISAFIFGFVLCMYITQCAIDAQRMVIDINTCFYVQMYTDYDTYVLLYQCISYILSVTVILVSTGILCCQLTCLRKNLLLNNFCDVQNRNRRSAIIVILISVVFVLSEVISIYVLSIGLLTSFVFDSDNLPSDVNIFYNFLQFSLMIGYSLNFFVYLLIGKKLRSTIGRGCSKICNIFRCCH